jgi:predicted dehydrogenase
MQASSRRDFVLRGSAALAGTALAAGPAVARSQASASDRIRVAVVGLGGRGRHSLYVALRQLIRDKKENLEVAALSDCDRARMNAAAGDCEKELGTRPALCQDFRKLLDDKSLDAVVFGTPNHWHALGTIWACQARKDVYVEKPASHNIFEGRKMVEAARKYERIVQHGTQCRSSPKIREGIELLKKGVIGRVYMARGVAFKLRAGGRNEIGPTPPEMNWDFWLGPAPLAPYNKLAVYRWRFLKDYGNGEIGDQGVHQLDIIRWGLGLDVQPNRVQSMGGNFVHKDDEDTPTNQLSACHYLDRNLIVQFETRNWYTNSEAGMGTEYPFVDHQNVVGVIFLGMEGYMIIPDYSSYYVFFGLKRKPGPSSSVPGNPMMDLDHMANWIAAVRSRKPGALNAEIEEGHLSSSLCHLANVAYRTGRTLAFDPKSERFSGDEEANRLLTRPYRAPYVVPQEV